MPFKKGHIPWSKGLTKETDPRIKSLSEALSGEKHPMYGKYRSAETKKKISEAHKGKYHSEGSRRKMSEVKSGKNNPNYGKHPSEETRRIISEALKGRSFTEETRIKISEAKKGQIPWNRGVPRSDETLRKMSLNHHNVSRENNPNWLGGKSFEPYGLEFNNELKKQIRERDNHQCQICGLYQEELSRLLNVHHIDYNKENNDPQNLISLCVSCHMKMQINRDEWKAYFKGAMAPLSSPILSLVFSLPAPLVEAPLPL